MPIRSRSPPGPGARPQGSATTTPRGYALHRGHNRPPRPVGPPASTAARRHCAPPRNDRGRPGPPASPPIHAAHGGGTAPAPRPRRRSRAASRRQWAGVRACGEAGVRQSTRGSMALMPPGSSCGHNHICTSAHMRRTTRETTAVADGRSPSTHLCLHTFRAIPVGQRQKRLLFLRTSSNTQSPRPQTRHRHCRLRPLRCRTQPPRTPSRPTCRARRSASSTCTPTATNR